MLGKNIVVLLRAVPQEQTGLFRFVYAFFLCYRAWWELRQAGGGNLVIHAEVIRQQKKGHNGKQNHAEQRNAKPLTHFVHPRTPPFVRPYPRRIKQRAPAASNTRCAF